ncbi:MAG: nucleotidyltransferase family protein [Methanoregula sp.]|nr:nucleotidyltransferase family protein [Methanoregula sp.]
MTSRREVMARLKSLKGELAAHYDVREIGIFGSVARGEDDQKSDIDLLVEFGSNADLITYIGLWQYLEDIFGTKIDLVSKGGLKSDMRDAVMRDLVFV